MAREFLKHLLIVSLKKKRKGKSCHLVLSIWTEAGVVDELLPLTFLISEMEFLACYTYKNSLTFILRKFSAWNVRLHLMSFGSVVGNNSHSG